MRSLVVTGALILTVAASACVSPLEPCVPEIGPGCRYRIPIYSDVDGTLIGYLQTSVFNPCLPKDSSDKKFSGWQVAPDTIKACPPKRSGLQP